jgi:hypothetical protein
MHSMVQTTSKKSNIPIYRFINLIIRQLGRDTLPDFAQHTVGTYKFSVLIPFSRNLTNNS